jgi:hypothetical protein
MKKRTLKIWVWLLPIMATFPVEILSQNLPINRWHYIQADSTRQKWGDFDAPDWLRYFGLDFGDANKDGYLDIISGRYFYLNPGSGLPWKKGLVIVLSKDLGHFIKEIPGPILFYIFVLDNFPMKKLHFF